MFLNPGLWVMWRIDSIAILWAVLICAACTNPEDPSSTVPPWDTTFIVSGVRFPNDSIFSRAVDFSPSNERIKAFLAKCQSKSSVRVGFIGGSITAGAGASSASLKYSSLFCSFLKGNFPNLDQVVEINAGVSATPSRFGVSRASSDLLSQSPDLIVIEFAVNDYGQGDDAFLGSTIEGLVRQCLGLGNDVPVMLLFTSKGDGTNVQDVQKKVGDHYSLPMISYRDAIWPLIEKKQVSFETFFFDDPHPNDNGHRVCAYLLYSYLKKEMERPVVPESLVTDYRFSDLYDDAGILDANDSVAKAGLLGWRAVSGEKGRLGFSSEPSDTCVLTLTSKAKELTLGIRMETSGAASIRVQVDQGTLDTILDNRYVFQYTKFITLYTSQTNAEHTVRIESLRKAVFNIDYVLYAGRSKE